MVLQKEAIEVVKDDEGEQARVELPNFVLSMEDSLVVNSRSTILLIQHPCSSKEMLQFSHQVSRSTINHLDLRENNQQSRSDRRNVARQNLKLLT